MTDKRTISEVDDPDQAYELGKRDGYEEAVQDVDRLTGGDGEYRYCMGVKDERNRCSMTNPEVEGLDGNAVRRIIQEVLGADFRLPGLHANQIAAKVNARLTHPLPDGEGGERSPVDGEAKIREAAQALVDKLKAIHEHPAFFTVFAVAQERLGPYGGPTYADELDALEGALASTKGGGRPVDREAKIREALEPFARLAEAVRSDLRREPRPSTVWVEYAGELGFAAITYGDLNRAREALASTQTGGGE